jgi:hypothetical protein
MTDVLRDGITWLEQQRTAHLAGEVEYRRDPDAYTVPATLGRTQYEVDDGYGLRVGATVVDFLIRAADLPIQPKPGDQIVADGVLYEVLSLGAEGAWRWSDPYRITRRIHTKELGTA